MVSFENKIFSQVYWKESLDKREKLRTNQEIKLAGIEKGQKVLDLRCGPGLKSKIISRRVEDTGEVICINENKFFIEQAKNFCRDCNNIKFIYGDVLDSIKLIKRHYGKNKKFDHIIFSWIHISPGDQLKLMRNVSKLLTKKGILTISRGGDNLRHPFSKLFNERLQENLYKIFKMEYPGLNTKLLLKLRYNINKAKIDIIDSFQDTIKLVKNSGFKVRQIKEVIQPITLKERLELYKNPLRNKHIGNLPLKERYRLIEKAFKATIKELGNKKLQTHRYYITFNKS